MEHQEDDSPTSTTWMKQIDDKIFGQSKEKVKKTKNEKRTEKRKKEQLEIHEAGSGDDEVQCPVADTEKHELDISMEGMKELKATDPTLRDVRIAVKEKESQEGVGFFTRDGLLYRRWVPRHRSLEGRYGDGTAGSSKAMPSHSDEGSTLSSFGGTLRTTDRDFTGQPCIETSPSSVKLVKSVRRCQRKEL